MSDIHPKLNPLLEKHDISYDDFSSLHKSDSEEKKERVREKRKKIVSSLHRRGMKWEKMEEVLGKPTSFIQRWTTEKDNEKTRENRKEAGRRAGRKTNTRNRLMSATSTRIRDVFFLILSSSVPTV